jgi:hypothetical protein
VKFLEISCAKYVEVFGVSLVSVVVVNIFDKIKTFVDLVNLGLDIKRKNNQKITRVVFLTFWKVIDFP